MPYKSVAGLKAYLIRRKIRGRSSEYAGICRYREKHKLAFLMYGQLRALAFPEIRRAAYAKRRLRAGFSPRRSGVLKNFCEEERQIYNGLIHYLNMRRPEYRAKRLASDRNHRFSEKRKQTVRDWLLKNRKKLRAQARARYKKDPERYRQYALIYAKKNKDKVAARLKRWRSENKFYCREYKRRLYSRNEELRQRRNSTIRKWQKNNLARVAASKSTPRWKSARQKYRKQWLARAENKERKKFVDHVGYFRRKYGDFAEAARTMNEIKDYCRKQH